MLEICFILLVCNSHISWKSLGCAWSHNYFAPLKNREDCDSRNFSVYKNCPVWLRGPPLKPNFGLSGSWSLNVKQKPTTMDKEIMNFNGPATIRNQKSSVTKTELDLKKTYIDSTINLTEIPPETSSSCLCHFLQSEVHTTKFVDKLLVIWISVPTFDLNIASFFFSFFFSTH